MTEELDKLDDDYTAKKVSYDNLPTFKRDMKERYDQVRNCISLPQCNVRLSAMLLILMLFGESQCSDKLKQNTL